MASDPTGTTTSPSVLDPYVAELERLSATLCGVLDVAARRSDLTSPTDALAIARIAALVEELSRRCAEPAAPGRRAVAANARTDLQSLSADAVHASLAESVQSRSAARRDEFVQWLGSAPPIRGIKGAPGAPRATAPSSGVSRTPRTLGKDELLPWLMRRAGNPPMNGTTDAMSAQTLFEHLVRNGRTGCLHLRTPDEHLRFVFVEGMIVATATDDQGTDQRLGEILRGLGLLPERHLATMVARAEREERPLGALLVAEQLLSIAQLKKALTIQVQARFERAFQTGFAAFAFVADAGVRVDDNLRVDARALVSVRVSDPPHGGA
ncbi:MAG: hypothetical protein HZB39_19805 [Planctomycetes bacterium]|nr:hypothetical protein [Planctomycetota bacterium]